MLFTLARQVRFQDIDAAGILFYARAFEYFHDAFTALLDARGVDLPKVIAERRWGAPLAHAEADFAAPMRYGDDVAIDVLSGELGDKWLRVRYRVRAEADESRVFCTGMLAHVFIDFANFKARTVPDEVRAIFTSPKAEGAP